MQETKNWRGCYRRGAARILWRTITIHSREELSCAAWIHGIIERILRLLAVGSKHGSCIRSVGPRFKGISLGCVLTCAGGARDQRLARDCALVVYLNMGGVR